MMGTSQDPDTQTRTATDYSRAVGRPIRRVSIPLSARPSGRDAPSRSAPTRPEPDMGDAANLELFIARLPAEVLLWLRRNGYLPSLSFEGKVEESLRSARKSPAVQLNELSGAIRWAVHLIQNQGRSEPIARQGESLAPPTNEEAK